MEFTCNVFGYAFSVVCSSLLRTLKKIFVAHRFCSGRITSAHLSSRISRGESHYSCNALLEPSSQLAHFSCPKVPGKSLGRT